MMGKLAILGDTHFAAGNANVIQHEYMRKFFLDFFQYVDDNDIKTVLQLGDLFDVRKHINTWALNFFREVFLKPVIERGLKVVVLLGNHDIFYRESLQISSVEEVLYPYPETFTVIKEPTETVLEGLSFLLVPWVCKENLNAVQSVLMHSSSTYCAGHFEFNGFELFRGQLAKTNYDHAEYKKFEKVFSGHYHHMSSKDNIIYTGTPYELTWQDCATTKGFFVIDSNSIDMVENPHTLYSSFALSEYPTIPESIIRDKHVKIKIDIALEPKKRDALLENVYSMKPHTLKLIEKTIDTTETKEISYNDITSVPEVIKDYVQNISIDQALDKTVLSDVLIQLFVEAGNAN